MTTKAKQKLDDRFTREMSEAAEGMRQPVDVLHEVGRHITHPFAAQGQRIHEPAKAPLDRRDDLIVTADRGKEMDDVVRHLPRHLAPLPLPGQRVELAAEILKPVHRQHRIISRGRAVKGDTLAHPFKALRHHCVVGAGGKKTRSIGTHIDAGFERSGSSIINSAPRSGCKRFRARISSESS